MLSFGPSSDLWLRKWSFVVYSAGGGQALELSAGVGQPGQTSGSGFSGTTGPQGQPLSEGLRMKFRTVAADLGVPNHAEIEVFNLSDATASRVMNKEFSQVVLQAGYSSGKYGVIFQGTIKQVKRGRESAVDSYIRIYAADSDYYFTHHAMEPQYVPRNSDAETRVKAIVDEGVKNGGIQKGSLEGLQGGGILPRGKVLWGMGNQNMDVTSSEFAQWSIQQGKIQTRKLNGYLSGEAVVLNAHSGLVGMPEATDQGVFATALLNPAVKVGGRAKINNGDINTSEPAVSATAVQQLGYPGFTDINLFASTAADGTYTVLLVEYEGDTRGNAWYMHLGMLLLDQSAGTIAPGASTAGALEHPVGGPTSPGHL